jgi:Abnormal spindle-like microcephaly-assoc'd, ASPM-SPD-2-Hydin
MRRLVVIAIVLGSAWLAAPADAFIYWSTGRYDTIGRANLDGTDAREAFVKAAGDAQGLALGNGIYWAVPGIGSPQRINSHRGSIGWASLDGTRSDEHFVNPAAAISFSISPNPPTYCPCHVVREFAVGPGVAVDAAHIYWTERHFIAGRHPHLGGDIGRSNLNGSDVQNLFIPTGPDPSALAADGSHIYWVNAGQGAIGRATAIGGAVTQRFIAGLVKPTGLALGVNGAYMYWSSAAGTIGRANYDGTGIDNRFITGADHPRAVAVDASHIYWVNANGTIGRADLDGTDVDQAFITGAHFAVGLAVNAGGAAGQASASQSSLSGFAPRAVGSTSPPQTLTITNTGDGPLKVSGARFTGADPSDFELPADACLGAAIAPGAKCTLQVSFKPTAPGTRTATLQVASNDPSAPLAIPVTGGAPWTLNLSSYPANSSGVPVIVEAVANDLLSGSGDVINIYVNGRFRARCRTTTCTISLAAAKPTTFNVSADVGPARTRPSTRRALVSASTSVTVAFTPPRTGSGPPT